MILRLAIVAGVLALAAGIATVFALGIASALALVSPTLALQLGARSLALSLSWLLAVATSAPLVVAALPSLIASLRRIRAFLGGRGALGLRAEVLAFGAAFLAVGLWVVPVLDLVGLVEPTVPLDESQWTGLAERLERIEDRQEELAAVARQTGERVDRSLFELEACRTELGAVPERRLAILREAFPSVGDLCATETARPVLLEGDRTATGPGVWVHTGTLCDPLTPFEVSVVGDFGECAGRLAEPEEAEHAWTDLVQRLFTGRKLLEVEVVGHADPRPVKAEAWCYDPVDTLTTNHNLGQARAQAVVAIVQWALGRTSGGASAVAVSEGDRVPWSCDAAGVSADGCYALNRRTSLRVKRGSDLNFDPACLYASSP